MAGSTKLRAGVVPKRKVDFVSEAPSVYQRRRSSDPQQSRLAVGTPENSAEVN